MGAKPQTTGTGPNLRHTERRSSDVRGLRTVIQDRGLEPGSDSSSEHHHPPPKDETIAHRAGQLLARADQAAGGESGIDTVDPMIAAIADIYDEPVLTDNVEDFEALGVDVETYRDVDRA